MQILDCLHLSGHVKHICGNIGCKEAFQYRNQRSRHRKKCLHTQVEKDFMSMDGGGYLCNKCGKTIQYQHNLSRHKLSCMKNVSVIEKVFPCKHCSKTFKYQSKLNEHARCHSHSMFRCESCERSFKRNDHLQNTNADQNQQLVPQSHLEFVVSHMNLNVYRWYHSRTMFVIEMLWKLLKLWRIYLVWFVTMSKKTEKRKNISLL